jgi:hypothetical protein
MSLHQVHRDLPQLARRVFTHASYRRAAQEGVESAAESFTFGWQVQESL